MCAASLASVQVKHQAGLPIGQHNGQHNGLLLVRWLKWTYHDFGKGPVAQEAYATGIAQHWLALRPFAPLRAG
jgi:hypothetical protein